LKVYYIQELNAFIKFDQKAKMFLEMTLSRILLLKSITLLKVGNDNAFSIFIFTASILPSQLKILREQLSFLPSSVSTAKSELIDDCVVANKKWFSEQCHTRTL